MSGVAIQRAHALVPGNFWDKRYGDLLIEAAAPLLDGADVDGVFCGSAGHGDVAALACDRLGLNPKIALSLEAADISGAAALYAAWQHLRAGACRTALVLAAAKVSDLSEAERIGLMDRTLDPDADVARGIVFTAQAGLLAGHYCREREARADVFAETTAANLAAFARHKGRPAPTTAEIRRDLPVAPPLVRSDFAQLLDGGCAVLLSAGATEGGAMLAAMASATDIVSVWDRRDPLALAAAETAVSRVLAAAAPKHLEIDAAASVVQRLAEDAVARAVAAGGNADRQAPQVNLRGGAQGQGRVFGASPLYQIADLLATRSGNALALSVGGLGAQAFAARVDGAA
jgi:hypothetical protein